MVEDKQSRLNYFYSPENLEITVNYVVP